MSVRRGRPPAYDRDTALRAIVDTFRQRGFAATSLDHLATATGMNRPSLFAAFGNKKAMYLAALQAFRHDMIAAVGPSLDKADSLPEAMTTFFDAAIRFYCSGTSQGCLVLCTATAEAPADNEIGAISRDVLAEIESQIRHRIERAVAEAEQDATADPAALSKLLSAVLTSVAIQARAGVPESELRLLARVTLTTVLDGKVHDGRGCDH